MPWVGVQEDQKMHTTPTTNPARKNKQKHPGEVSLTTWLPPELAQELDRFLASQVEGRVGVKPSRQAFVLRLLRDALDRARAGTA